MFYEILKDLCTAHKTTPTAVMKSFGFSTSMLTNWKNGGMPRGDTHLLLAENFGVSTDYLLTGKVPVASPQISPDEQQVLDAYRSHPELHAVIRKLLDMPEPQSEDGAVS